MVVFKQRYAALNIPDPLNTICLTRDFEISNTETQNIPMFSILDQTPQNNKAGTECEFSQSLILKILYAMEYVRLLDERMIAAQRQGRVSFYLACRGEEAAVVASTAALNEQDMIMSQYREQGALAYRGYTPAQFMNQMFSNHLDPNKGRQMPIHYGDKKLNFMTVSSPLGTQIPQAAGYAFGQRLDGINALTMCYFGEGAASEGDFHAGLNMAAVLQCPVIFFCRNNGYAISTPTEEQFMGDGIAARGAGYGIKTLRVDGNDALAVYATTKIAREFAIAHSQPVLIEAMTYRLAAHSTSDDPAGYRSQKEEQQWLKKDPVARLKRWLDTKGWLDSVALDEFCSSTRKDILDALKVAEKIAGIKPEEIVDDVYKEIPWHLEQQRDELLAHLARNAKCGETQ